MKTIHFHSTTMEILEDAPIFFFEFSTCLNFWMLILMIVWCHSTSDLLALYIERDLRPPTMLRFYFRSLQTFCY